MSGLSEYQRKRNFGATPEPKGRREQSRQPIFVIQRHAASRLHFDFRLEINGALILLSIAYYRLVVRRKQEWILSEPDESAA